MQLEDVPFIGDKWRTTGIGGKLVILLASIIAALSVILGLIIKFDQAYPIILRWNLTEIISTLLDEYGPELIVSNIILLLLEALLVLIVLTWTKKKMEKEIEAKESLMKKEIEARETLEYLHEKLLQENEELVEQMLTGKVPLEGKVLITTRAGGNIRVIKNISLFDGKSAKDRYKIYKDIYK